MIKQKNRPFLGWIALDIDGTITCKRDSVPINVVHYLQKQVETGWHLVITTGRSMSLAQEALQSFYFPFTLMAQNGSIVREMPGQKVILRHYIAKEQLNKMDAMYGIEGDFVVFGGIEQNDCIYYRPQKLTSKQWSYVQGLGALFHAVDEWKNVHPSAVPLIKCFGSREEMEPIAQDIRKSKLFNEALIRDPFSEHYILLVTDKKASKGATLRSYIELSNKKGPIIAAGDDENDLSLLQAADVAIAMANAPDHLKAIAHYVAPPAEECGIIPALETAIPIACKPLST